MGRAAAQALHSRLQPLLLFFIDAASYITEPGGAVDRRWELYLAVQDCRGFSCIVMPPLPPPPPLSVLSPPPACHALSHACPWRPRAHAYPHARCLPGLRVGWECDLCAQSSWSYADAPLLFSLRDAAAMRPHYRSASPCEHLRQLAMPNAPAMAAGPSTLRGKGEEGWPGFSHIDVICAESSSRWTDGAGRGLPREAAGCQGAGG